MLSERDAIKRESTILISSAMSDERLANALMTIEQLTLRLSQEQRDHQQQVITHKPHPHTLTHWFNGHPSRWTLISRLPLDSSYPFVPDLCILLGQADTFHFRSSLTPSNHVLFRQQKGWHGGDGNGGTHRGLSVVTFCFSNFSLCFWSGFVSAASLLSWIFVSFWAHAKCFDWLTDR